MREKTRKSNLGIMVILMLAAFGITGICAATGAYVQEGYSLSPGSVSQKRFTAPKETENRMATEKLREEAAAAVLDQYKRDPRLTAASQEAVEVFFDGVGNIRAEMTPIYNPTQGEQQSPVSSNSSGNGVLRSESEYLAALPSAEYDDFYGNVMDILNAALEAGVRDENIGKSLNNVKEDLSDLEWAPAKQDAAYSIISRFIEPNLVVDEEATNKMREEKAAEVKPVMYHQGQKIIDAGEIITDEIYQVLSDLGYVGRSFTDNLLPFAGAMTMIALVFVLMGLYIYHYLPQITAVRKNMLLVFTLYSFFVVVTRAASAFPFFFMPLLLVVMLASVLVSSRFGMAFAAFLTIVGALIYRGDMNFIFYFLINGCFFAILGKSATERSKVFKIALYSGLMGGLTVLGSYLLFERGFSQEMLDGVVYSVLACLLSVIICIGSLPLWEVIFGIVTPIKLLELANPSNKLLRRLAIEAPGTYHHSIVVANLAETACYDIGANQILARAGAFYHDIGKLKHPGYFAENQQGGENPHNYMEPRSSVEILLEHVKYGLHLADEERLPYQIRGIIEQHHGNTLMKFFYYKERNLHPDEEIDPDDFRYNFKIPQTPESAVVMLADTVEAAVRSTISTGKTMEEVEALVRELIKDKLDDNQLSQSGLAISDLHVCAKAFMRVLKGMYHERVKYPTAKELKLEKGGEATVMEKEGEEMEGADRLARE